MAKKFLVPIDMGKLEIQNEVIQVLAADPSSPAEGQRYYNSVSKKLRIFNGTTWDEYSTGAAGDVTQSANSGGAGRMKVSAGANKVIADLSGVVGLVKTDTNGVVSLAVVGTDYSVGTSALATGILKSTTTTGALSIAVAGDFPTLNQNTTGSAATLTTPRSIYGNNFNGSADLAQIIASTFGGTGNGFTKFSGPATAEKTFTLPNASATILTDNAVVTGAQGGTGVNNSGKTITLGGNLTTSGAFASTFTMTNTTTVTFPTTGTLATTTDISSGTFTFTNKTFDAAGTGNSLSNISTSMFAANVVDTDGTLAANSDTRLSSQKATKTYVDTFLQGVKWKDSVRAATTAAGTLATSFENGDTIDGVVLATGDRILIKDQAAGAENGIYTVNASGAPTRATDADTGTEVRGMVVTVREGTANADHAFINTNDAAITLGTTALTFTDFISANVPLASTTVIGKVELATQAEAEAKASSTLAVTPASLATFTRKITSTIGDGSTTAIAVTDNLGTTDKIARIRTASGDVEQECDITYASNTTTFTFAVAPATNAIKVVIIG